MDKSVVESLPLLPGVYIFKNHKKRVIYVGKSVRIRDRVKSYFDNYKVLEPKTQKMVEEIATIDYIVTETELEALILEAALIKQYKPTYNVQWKDDKNYFFIGIQNGAIRQKKGLGYVVKSNLWPYVYLTHQTKNDKDLFFGPFTSGKEVKKALKILRSVFGWCEYKNSKQVKDKKGCFYYQIKMCPGICKDEISLQEYWKTIDYLIWFLQGKKVKVIKQLEEKMQKLANDLNFEAAAKIKNWIEKLNNLTTKFHLPDDYLQNPNLIDDIYEQEVKGLIGQLGLSYDKKLTDFVIEAYDISHLGNIAGVGSRVVFVGGKPDKNYYRRYRLKQVRIPDDYGAMAEVIKRRFKNKDNLPDLVVIDGGKGQVTVVKKELDKMGLSVPVIGLVKHPDRVVVFNQTTGRFNTLTVKNDKALRLLQRIRDEAHRFANSYRRYLMKKRLKT